MQTVVDQLKSEQSRLEKELRGVSAALSAFGPLTWEIPSPPRSAPYPPLAGRELPPRNAPDGKIKAAKKK